MKTQGVLSRPARSQASLRQYSTTCGNWWLALAKKHAVFPASGWPEITLALRPWDWLHVLPIVFGIPAGTTLALQHYVYLGLVARSLHRLPHPSGNVHMLAFMKRTGPGRKQRGNCVHVPVIVHVDVHSSFFVLPKCFSQQDK